MPPLSANDHLVLIAREYRRANESYLAAHQRVNELTERLATARNERDKWEREESKMHSELLKSAMKSGT